MAGLVRCGKAWQGTVFFERECYVKRYKVTDVLKLIPGPSPKVNHLQRLLPAGRKTLTLQEVLELDIPAEDKVWFGLRKLPKPLVFEIACDFAMAAAEHDGDAQVKQHVKDTRRYLDTGLLYGSPRAVHKQPNLEASCAAYAARAARCAVFEELSTVYATSSAKYARHSGSMTAAQQVELVRLYAVIAEC